MARSFVINGETMVKVKGGAHLLRPPLAGVVGELTELGLSSESIRVTPTYYQAYVPTADFGPNAPAEVMWNMAHVDIGMVLVHYDRLASDICMAESMGGQVNALPAGVMQPAGQMLGRGLQPLASGCHYLSLNLLSPVLDVPWRFPTAYLTAPPQEIPLGTSRTMLALNWRAVCYVPPILSGHHSLTGGGVSLSGSSSLSGNPRGVEVTSSGRVLWDHTLET